MYFRNYRLGKMQLDKCLKSGALRYVLTSNIVNAPEHCSNLNDGNFTIFIHYCEDNKV